MRWGRPNNAANDYYKIMIITSHTRLYTDIIRMLVKKESIYSTISLRVLAASWKCIMDLFKLPPFYLHFRLFFFFFSIRLLQKLYRYLLISKGLQKDMLIVTTWSDKNSHSTRWDSYIVEVRFACILPGLSSLQTFWIYSRSSSIWEINDNNQSVLQFSEKHLIAFILKFIYSVLMTTTSSPKGNVLNSCLC